MNELEKSAARVLHFGVSYSDFRKAAEAGDVASFSEALESMAAHYEATGYETRAAVYYHYAQFKLRAGERKNALKASCRRSYAKAAGSLHPPVTRVEGREFAGYLRSPISPTSCVVLINGLDSAKEVELHAFAEGFLRRGSAVFYWDTPLPLHRHSSVVSAVLDALTPQLGDISFGVFGVSFGGFLACHAAASDARIAACVSLGGFHDARIVKRLPPPALDNLRLAYGLSPDADVAVLDDVITLEPLRGRMQRPLLIVHGTNDHLVDASQVDALKAWGGPLAETLIYEGAEHVCTDRFSEALPAIWDWMTETGRRAQGAGDSRDEQPWTGGGPLPPAPCPLPPSFIDLSVELDETPSERVPIRVRRVDHQTGAKEMAAIFGVDESRFPDSLGWAGEEVNLITHSGTHMDAPWHYGPSRNGQPAYMISEVPLEWCYGPGVVLDFRHLEDGAEITPRDLEQALQRANHRLAPGDIVLLMTGCDAWWGTAEYPDRGSGLGRDGLVWLVERGVRVIGIDAWGMDRPFGVMKRQYEETGDAGAIWPAHFAGREHPYCQLEKLTNLHALPPTGFKVLCFPVKVARAGAGWARVVAMVENGAGS
jgi:kynurenine formamidase/pimeloyl-ACP methyl ester carboxylesterase